MNDIINPLQNTSYTNKDFQAIYPELLEMVEKLSDKWKPSESNESDPGNILIKLAAIIADKNNYNIDKNILECFPLSVTQEKNARQLYQQLGYRMKLNKAASGSISLQFIGDIPNDAGDDAATIEFTIPAFTMFSNNDNSVVYTTTKECVLSASNNLVDGEKKPITQVDVLQGTIDTFTINGTDIVTLNTLDDNYRLYLPFYDIAENGIFIRNIGSIENWTRVDFIDSARLGKNFKVFEFDVDPISGQYYIGFPSNIADIIDNGITIKYIRTLGRYGNVSAGVINKFFNNLNLTYKLKTSSSIIESDSTIELNTENVTIKNVSAILNGEDAEDLNNAYRNYKKTVGTFNTLVTLLDYTNYLNTKIVDKNIVSNGFVTDRTNDPQLTYDVITFDTDQNRTTTHRYVDNSLSAFDLKLYMLKPVVSSSTYDSTFDLISDDVVKDTVINEFGNAKSIQHDFKSILNDGKISLFRNRYSINCRIIPQYSLTDLQIQSIEDNVVTTLYETFDAKHVSFGEAIDYQEVYDAILKADERIQYIILDNLDYATFAVYWDNSSNSFKELCISDNFTDQYDIGLFSNNFSDAKEPDNKDSQYLDRLTHKIYTYDGSAYGLYSDKIDEFRTEIYAKSVLAGKTQLLDINNNFNFNLQQKVNTLVDNISKVTTQAVIQSEEITATTGYKIKENESLLLYRPNLINDTVYSTYVRFQTNITNIEKDADYKLNAGDKLILYWRSGEDDTTPYSYQTYTAGQIICPSFNLTSNVTNDDFVIQFTDTTSGITTPEQTEKVSKLYDAKFNLSGSKQIATRKLNSVDLNTVNGGRNLCYWVLNSSTDNKCVLFTKDDIDALNDGTKSSLTYTLQTGEYFMYTNDSGSFGLAILGSGTNITLMKKDGIDLESKEWSVKKRDYSNISQQGVDAFDDNDWFIISASKESVILREMQIYSFGKGTTVHINYADLTDINNTPQTITSGEGVYIRYKEEGSSSWENLPMPIIGEDFYWKCRSFFSLNMSSTLPQILFANQSIVATNQNGDSTTITGTSTGLSVSSNFRLAIDGGIDIDVRQIDRKDNIVYLSLFAFTVYNDTTGIVYKNDKVYINGDSSDSVDVPYQLVSGNSYLMPVTITSGDIVSPIINSSSVTIVETFANRISSQSGSVTINLTYDINKIISISLTGGYGKIDLSDKQMPIQNEPWIVTGGDVSISAVSATSNTITVTLSASTMTGMESLSDKDIVVEYVPDVDDITINPINGSTSNQRYYVFQPNDSLAHSINFKATAQDQQFSAIIDNLYVINNYDNLISASSKEGKVFTKLKTLDSDNLYKYTHIVSNDNAVLNPLNAESFNDSNHIFNQNTICMIGRTVFEPKANKSITSGIDIAVVNRRK